MAVTIRALSEAKPSKNPGASQPPPSKGRWQMPAELGFSTSRPVRFTATGRFLVCLVLALVSGAFSSVPAVIAKNERNLAIERQLNREGVQVEAQVIEVKGPGEDGERVVRYRYDAGGRRYQGRTTLRQKEARELRGTLAVRYLAGDPRRSWAVGHEPAETPGGVLAVMAVLLLIVLTGALLLSLHLRRQRSMLAEGRAVEARVVSVQKAGGGHEHKTQVEYEFHLLNGATRRVKTFQDERKPVPGSSATLLYDRDDPARFALYPLSSVTIDRTL